MKYMLTWTERRQGSPIEYENAQKRMLEVFTQWKVPGNFKNRAFVIPWANRAANCLSCLIEDEYP
jgi:hypothetical protein